MNSFLHLWPSCVIAPILITILCIFAIWRKKKCRIAKEDRVHTDYIRGQIILTAAGRTLSHETANFLNNIDLVVHGLKNENLSLRGENILRLLARENLRVKPYMQHYRKLSAYPDIWGKSQDIKSVIKGLVPRRQEETRMRIHYYWADDLHAATCMNRLLFGEAFSSLLESAAISLSTDNILEIHASRLQDKIRITMTHGSLIDMADQEFAEAGFLSNLFIARAIIEAHRGHLNFTEDFQGKPAYEITLPSCLHT